MDLGELKSLSRGGAARGGGRSGSVASLSGFKFKLGYGHCDRTESEEVSISRG